MNATAIEESDEIYRLRHGTLQSVDDLIAEIFALLDAAGETNNTYFFFTSDNVSICSLHLSSDTPQGFHLGQFAMGYDKRQLYESDSRVPYIVMGPGIKAGSIANQAVSHVDLVRMGSLSDCACISHHCSPRPSLILPRARCRPSGMARRSRPSSSTARRRSARLCCCSTTAREAASSRAGPSQASWRPRATNGTTRTYVCGCVRVYLHMSIAL